MQSLILLHGALGSAEDLQALSEKITTSSVKLHFFSFSGHGGIATGAEFGIDAFALELKNYIHNNHLTKPIIFGYSMGAYVALTLAAHEPEMIGKIICLGTKFNWNKEFVANETALLKPEILQEKAPAFALSLQNKHGKYWIELLFKTAKMMHELAEKEHLPEDTLATIRIPVLIGIGDKDKMVSLNETLQTFRALPNASMYVLPNSKHPIESVNTELLGKIVLDFILRDHSGERL